MMMMVMMMMIVVRTQTYDDGFKETLGDGEPIVWIFRPRLPFLLYQLPLWKRAIEKDKTTIKSESESESESVQLKKTKQRSN